jgi:hypothetical protein
MANEEREPRPQSANDLTAVARELEYIASIYKDAAAAIGEANAESLDVAGIPTRDRGMGYVRGSLRFLQKAVNDLRIGKLKGAIVVPSKQPRPRRDSTSGRGKKTE